MKKTALLFFVLFIAKINFAQTVAATRAANFGLGQNISNWLERGFDSDWPRPNVYTKADLQKMKDAGIKSLRLPACFERITDTIAPYYVDTNHVLFSYIDSVISWANELNMNVTIDNHHLWDSITNTAWRTQEQRFTHMWAVVANHYAYLDPERYTFELWNEPNLTFAADSLRILFSEAIDSIRQFAPNHTIIVSPNLGSEGFTYSSAYLPFADTNLIYTWHCYDPLDFTHQGFTWESPYFPVGTTFPTNNPSVFSQFLPLSLSSVQDWIA
ncbi:MAG TPA: cellulase family glycosylhydrolase, partial [Arachidicoccus sp.]